MWYSVHDKVFESESFDTIQECFNKSLNISIKIPPISKFSRIEEQRTLSLSLNKDCEVHVQIGSELGKIRIKTYKRDDWQEFINSNFQQLIGLLSATLISEDKEDFLWIESDGEGQIWVMGIVWRSNVGYWEGMLTKCPRQADLNVDFWIMANEKDKRKQAARILFNSMTNKETLGLPEDFPFCLTALTSSQSRYRQLTIRVHPSELWFLLFPIDYFCQFGYGHFSIYKEVEWIITAEKTFIQNIYERVQIRNELQDVKKFLKHSVVIINTYQHFDQDPVVKDKCHEGTDLAKEILSLFQNIKIDDETLSLRWHLNPGKEKINSELSNSMTCYFFGDFHVENGKWQCGEDEWLALDSFRKGALSHIRLMRIFHCHSVGKIVSGSVQPSIVPLLLNAGVFRVEGSIIEEDYLDYLCSLLSLFLQPQGLQPLLLGKCLEKSVDFSNIKMRATNFMKLCGWNIVV